MNMSDNTIADGKYVEVTYKVIDQISGAVLTQVEFPLGYVHGTNEILAPAVMAELEGKKAGEVIEVPIDCKQIYGPRDESLVITDRIQNVPEEYREVGMSILMESVEPRRQELFRRLNRVPGATNELVQMRALLLAACKRIRITTGLVDNANLVQHVKGCSIGFRMCFVTYFLLGKIDIL